MSDLGLEILPAELERVEDSRSRLALGLACLTRSLFATSWNVDPSIAETGEAALVSAWDAIVDEPEPWPQLRGLVAELSKLEWSTPAAPWLGHDMRLIASHLMDYLDERAASSLHLAAGAAIRSLEELSEHALVRDGAEVSWGAKYLYPAILREVGNQRVDLAMTDLGANAALPAIHKRAVEEGRVQGSDIQDILAGPYPGSD